VGGLSPNDRARIRNHKIGFVFQGFNLLHRTTAIENVELPILYDGLSGRERAAKAGEALERVGLGDRRYHYPNQLSGGQQQRVAIARALVMQPPLILADEPTGNLDTRTSIEIMALFQELNREEITLLVVTHEPDIARYARRIINFRDGTVRSDQSVADHVDAREALSKERVESSPESERKAP
jgi:putative ABC transport system ATP-binding protein